MHITLYRKYRPSSFSEVSGENEIVKSLKLSLKNKSMAHAYLFSGPRGVGKTTIARLIAKGVNCLNLKETGEPCNECKNCKAINEGRFSDLIEIDAASNRSIDEIRSLKEKINYQPVEGLKKVYIIDEAHMLTKEAFNALLKTLEEPPAHVMFILATTELEKILPTIISRCQRYDFKPLDLEEMKSGLEHILKEENLSMTDDVYPVIYENSSGSMRDSISILERLIVTANGEEIDFSLSTGYSTVISNYRNGVLDGARYEFDDKGSLTSATEYNNGVKEGTEVKFANGIKTQEDVYRNGRKNGKSVSYYTDGSLKAEGTYVDNVRDNEWNWYYPASEGRNIKRLTETYDYGKLKSIKGQYPDGSKERKAELVNGNGDFEQYYNNGAIKLKGKIRNYAADGTWTAYDLRGVPVARNGFNLGISQY